MVLALVCLALAAAPATGVGRDAVEGLVAHVPGAGLLRDSQKWLAPFVLAVCLGVGAAVARLQPWLVRRGVGYTGYAAALVPLAVLPGLAWGLFGRIEPVSYPAEWSVVAADLARLGGGEERTVVLPFSVYRRFGWNEQRAVLDPAPRFFPGDVVTDDSLGIGARTVAGEDPDAARIREAIAGERPLGPVLAAAGIRFVLVERGTPGVVPDLPDALVRHDGPELRLLDLGSGAPPRSTSYARWLVGADLAVLLAVLGIATNAMVRRRLAYTPRREKHV